MPPPEMACPDLGSSSCPLVTPAFPRKDGSTATGQMVPGWKALSIPEPEYLLLGDLNVGTLASISDAHVGDLAYNSKQTEGKIHSYCAVKIETKKELLILIPQPRISDADNGRQE